mgnify:CR=1 FL=1
MVPIEERVTPLPTTLLANERPQYVELIEKTISFCHGFAASLELRYPGMGHAAKSDLKTH